MAHLLSWLQSRTIKRQEYSFHGLLFALMDCASSEDRERLCRVFPEIHRERSRRRRATDGALTEQERSVIVKSIIKRTDRWPKKG